jgi:hypothetical protein
VVWGYSRIVILAVLGDGCNEVAGGSMVHSCCGGRDDQFLGGSVDRRGRRGGEWIVNLFSRAEYLT